MAEFFRGGFQDVIGIGLQVTIPDISKKIDKLENGLDAILEIRATVREYAAKLQAQAVANVSGIQVTYSGGSFIVNRQTGKLARSIQVVADPGGSMLGAAVVASANYASMIEGGTAARDLKPVLMGKTIVFKSSFNSSKGQKSLSEGGVVRQKRASTGRKSGKEVLQFRKIGPRSTGWIIPAQKPRPFMQAAAEMISPLFSDALDDVMKKYFDGL